MKWWVIFQVLLRKDKTVVQKFQAPSKEELSCFIILFPPRSSLGSVAILHQFHLLETSLPPSSLGERFGPEQLDSSGKQG